MKLNVFTLKGSNVPNGIKYNTLVLVMDASIKRLDGSGITLEKELTKTKKVIEWAKANDVAVIGMHIAGASSRGVRSTDINEMIIN